MHSYNDYMHRNNNQNVLRQFDLNLLLLFEALLSECHVSRAAEKMYLSQSAMSHALNRLREQLDDPVLVRTSAGLQPTPRARAMLPDIRRALQLVDQALQPDQPFDPARSERYFRIACTDYFEATVLPELICDLQISAPGVYIEVEMINKSSFSEKLEQRTLDLIIGLDCFTRVPAHLHSHTWLTEQLVCLVARHDQRLADCIDLDHYTRLQHVVFSDSEGEHSSSIDQWLSAQGLKRKSIARTTNYMAAARIVAQTQTVMTLPEKMAQLFCHLLPLRIVQPPPGIPASEMKIIHHPLQHKDPGLQWLMQKIRDVSESSTQNMYQK